MTDSNEASCSRGTSPEPVPPQYVLDALATIGILRNPEHEQLPTSEEPWMTCTEPNGEQGADTLKDALQTMTRATENDVREQFRAALKWHVLTEIRCDHDAKTDTAMCGCALWRSDAMPSVGAATDAWVEHVLEQVP